MPSRYKMKHIEANSRTSERMDDCLHTFVRRGNYQQVFCEKCHKAYIEYALALLHQNYNILLKHGVCQPMLHTCIIDDLTRTCCERQHPRPRPNKRKLPAY